MSKVELSIFIEANYPATAKSIAKRKPLLGVGLNDAHYVTAPLVNGKQISDPAYDAWTSMLKRAYNRKYQLTHPTYSDVTVCKDWHSFSAFRNWWLAHYREGCQLDKDILLVGNREYSPWSCLYVPQWLNTFTVDNRASRGEFPIGVCLDRCCGKYKSNCCNPVTGKRHHLGLFTSPEEAHEAWLNRKLQLADQLKQEMDAIDKRIYPNVVTIIKAAR